MPVLKVGGVTLAGKRILVVEDEYFIAADVKRALEAVGADVVGPVGTESPGLDLAANITLDGAVLDVNLTGLPCYSLAAALQRRGVPFLFLTGYEASALPPTYKDAHIITKPCTMDGVVRRMADIIGQGRTA